MAVSPLCSWSEPTSLTAPAVEVKEQAMAEQDGVFLYVGTYGDEATARADYRLVQDLHQAKAIGSYDALVVTRDDAGKVHVDKDETAVRRGAWSGAVVGAFVGVVLPPVILGAAVAGAAVGGVGAHLRQHLSRSDVEELGDLIGQGEAALVVLGRSRLDDVLDGGRLNAQKYVSKQLGVKAKDLDQAVHQAVREVGPE
jgi:uncharacterized membrane protein